MNDNNRLVAQIIVIAGKRVVIDGVKEDLQVVMPFGSAETSIYGILPYVLVGQLLGYYTSLSHGVKIYE